MGEVMALSVYWLLSLSLMTAPMAVFTEFRTHGLAGFFESAIGRNVAETQFIRAEFGVVFEPKRLSRRDRLSLKLTNMLDETI